jgi:hypothetical protein
MSERDDDVEVIDEPHEVIDTHYRPPLDERARWLFDYTRLYWELKAKLLGGWLVTDEKSGSFKIERPRRAVAFMNDRGVEQTMAVVNGFITIVQGTSIYDEQRIYALCFEFNEKLNLYYYQNMDDFDLPPDRASLVIRLIVDGFEANMRKSIGGASLKIIGSTERVIETRATEKPAKRFGLF